MNVVLWDTRVKRVIFLQVGELFPPPILELEKKRPKKIQCFP